MKISMHWLSGGIWAASFRAGLGARVSVFVLVALMGFVLDASARVWTDKQGRTIEAELVAIGAGKLTIKRADGQVFTIALDTLSLADQNHIKALLAGRQAQGGGGASSGGGTMPWLKPRARFKDGSNEKSGMVREPDGSLVFFKYPAIRTPMALYPSEAPPLKWPARVEAPRVAFEYQGARVAEANGVKKNFHMFSSPHFELFFESKVSDIRVEAMVRWAEATYKLWESSPFRIFEVYYGFMDKAIPIYFYERKLDFEIATGASAETPGVTKIDGGKLTGVFMNMEKLKSPNQILETLIHEVTHVVQATFNRPYSTNEAREPLPNFFIEGIARYAQKLPRGNAYFNFASYTPFYVHAHSKRFAIEGIYKFEAMEKFTHENWHASLLSHGPTMYTSAWFWVYYFMHLDGSEGARFYTFVHAMTHAVPYKEARLILLGGRSLEELNRDFKSKMKFTKKWMK